MICSLFKARRGVRGRGFWLCHDDIYWVPPQSSVIFLWPQQLIGSQFSTIPPLYSVDNDIPPPGWRYCSLPFGPIIVTVFEEVDRHLTSRAPEKTKETKINWRQPNQTGQKAWLPIQDPCYISWSGSRPSSSKKYLWGETSRHKIDGYGFNHYG